jgi:drug/metabolite transporter (DMT)-like permease
MSRRSWLALLLLGSLWGASYMFIKIALDDLSPAMIVFARTALAALVLVPLAAHRRALGGLSGALGAIAVLALVQVAGPFLLISAGEQEISSSLTGILVSSMPLFTAVLAIWVDHAERSTGPRAVGLVGGFAGVALLIGVDLGGSSNALLGGLAVTLAALGYAIGSFIVKRTVVELEPVGVAAATIVASTVLVAPLALASAPGELPGLDTVGAMLALGLVGTGLAFAIFYTLTASIGPARVALVTYIAPAFAVFYGVTLLGERASVGTFAGLVLIVGGSWLAAGGSLPGRRRAARPVPEYVPAEGTGPVGRRRPAESRAA